MIQIKNLTKKFDDFIAINNLSLTLDKGIVGLVGQNGAGKSTLFRTIVNVYHLNEGEILINGFKNNTKEAKDKIFFLPDDPYAPNNSSIPELFNFYNTFYDLDKEKFDSLVNLFHLPRDKKISSFSKGMKRQAFISIALSTKNEILLLDEAFDGLDPLTLDTIKVEILKANENNNRLIVISTHNITALENLVDNFVLIHEGELKQNGTIEQLGQSFIKYQALFNNECSEEILINHGLDIITYRKVGSIINFVIRDANVDVNELLKDLKPTLLESVAIDSNEIITLQMIASRKEKEYENK